MRVQSWVAVYHATGSNLLLGGVTSSRSSRWGSPELAENFLHSAIEINRMADRPATGQVVPDSRPPQIFVHCGTHHQAVGGICSGCGKKLTKQDAIEYGKRVDTEV